MSNDYVNVDDFLQQWLVFLLMQSLHSGSVPLLCLKFIFFISVGFLLFCISQYNTIQYNSKTYNVALSQSSLRRGQSQEGLDVG